MLYDLRIYLLGGFRLYRAGRLIPPGEWHTRQARQLFKLLLTEYARPISAQRLINLLWPEQIEHPDKTLRSAMSMLRNVLEPERTAYISSCFLPRARSGYTLTFPPDCSVWIDTLEFERLLQATTQERNPAQRRSLLEAALDLYAGDYLMEDEGANWTYYRRLQLRARYFQGVIALIKLYSQEALFDDALALGHRALAFDACNEPLYRSLMQCQATAGNCAGALQTFEQCRHTLNETLGADPSPQTQQLHHAILTGQYHEHSLLARI